MILVINFGAQYAHLIARRIRELGVYSEILPHDASLEKIKSLNPEGIILSGGPASVYEKNAPKIDKKIFDLGIPVLGICYGLQLIGKHYGKVLPGKLKEYGKRFIFLKSRGELLQGLNSKEQVWMSHGDLVSSLPKDFEILAITETCPIAAMENTERNIYGLQFHPEVSHTLKGMQILENFVFGICKNIFPSRSILTSENAVPFDFVFRWRRWATQLTQAAQRTSCGVCQRKVFVAR